MSPFSVESERHSPLETALRWLARGYPWPVSASDALQQAVRTLGWTVKPETVVRAGYTAGVSVTLFVGMVSGLRFGFLGMVFALICGIGTIHAVHVGPVIAARARRTVALGDAPGLVSRAVLRMRLSPTPEGAAAFAASSGDGPLAASLDRHVRQARLTGDSGFALFASAWGERFPPLRRSVALITAAGSAPPEQRERVLDRALKTVLDGVRERMREFGAEIRGPTTALYAFGVLLPTALVALLPAAATAGVAVTPATVVFAYNLVLPALLVGTGVWLLGRRPVAFPPPDVSKHPDATPATAAWIAGPAVAVATWLVTAPTLPGWGPPIAAVGFGLGTGLFLYYRPVVAVYAEIRAGERELADALSLTGRRVADGQAVETAITETAPELDGPLGDAFDDCCRRQQQLQASVSEALFASNGALVRLPSRRIRGSMALLALAADEGRPAGEALLSLADHTDTLQRVRRDAQHELAYVCRTLSSTAMLFGPLVAGATVALAHGMAGETFGGGDLSLTWLGGPVGIYVLILAVVLTALSTGLRHGLDRPLVGYRVGKALISATAAYLCAYLLVGLL